ncbi:hypothetical protein [Streptomyces sp. NPDC058653]|uniref:hypothetical protein n=1 Tax=Streptomyces sp. NPDC058653 TaxID=3346576 RepID=UPI00366A0883
MSAHVSRPTENAAVFGNSSLTLPSPERLADLLIVARATNDRYGARHFSSMLDRLLGLGTEAS